MSKCSKTHLQASLIQKLSGRDTPSEKKEKGTEEGGKRGKRGEVASWLSGGMDAPAPHTLQAAPKKCIIMMMMVNIIQYRLHKNIRRDTFLPHPVYTRRCYCVVYTSFWCHCPALTEQLKQGWWRNMPRMDEMQRCHWKTKSLSHRIFNKSY